MALPVKEPRTANAGVAGRRSTRLSIAIPVAFSGKDRDGNSFKENSRTVVINKQGAKILTVHQVALGSEIVIENRALGLSGRASVVWIGDRKSPKDAAEMGVQLLDAGNIWGIEFPPDDWQEGPPIGVGGVRLEAAGAMSAPSKAPEVMRPMKIDEKPPERPSDLGASSPAAASVTPREAAPPRTGQAPSGRTAPPSSGGATPEQIAVAQEVALVRFSQQLQATAEEQVKLFVGRLAKLTNQIGIQMQSSLHSSAAEVETKMVHSLDEHIGSLLDRLQATRSEVDGLLARLQELQQSGEAEVEKTKRNIQEAGWQALQAATEQLDETLQKDIEKSTQSALEDTSKKLQENAALVLERLTEESNSRLSALLDTFAKKSLPELQMLQTAGLEQTRRAVGDAAQRATGKAIEALETRSNSVLHDFQAKVETSVTAAREKSIDEVSQHVRKTAKELGAASEDELQKQAKDARQLLKEDLKNASKTLAEDGKKQLSALTNETLGALNTSVKSGLDEFQNEVEKQLHLFEDKAARDLESHFQKSAEKHREALLKISATMQMKRRSELWLSSTPKSIAP